MNTMKTTAALAALLTTTAAHAAADYAVSVSQPASVTVDTVARYTVTVRNVGNRDGGTGALTITLPTTNTSPQVYVLGTVAGVQAGCSRSGAVVTCPVARIRKGRQSTFTVDVAFPYSAAPLEIDASVTMSGTENTLANNDATHAVVLQYVDTPITGPVLVSNDHCTGTSLSSFFECECFPSSISSHDAVLEANGTISIPGEPGYGGQWTQASDDHLLFWYTYGPDVVATFEGYGVGGNCFEGITTFPNSSYVSPYRVCLP